jgi:hypothetical protein
MDFSSNLPHVPPTRLNHIFSLSLLHPSYASLTTRTQLSPSSSHSARAPISPLTGGFYSKASNVLASLSILFPSRLKVVDHKYGSRDEYRSWLIGTSGSGFRDTFGISKASNQTSSPFAWIESSDGGNSFVGGCDDTLAWCKEFCAPKEDGGEEKAVHVDDGHTKGHGYDYDLVVIGGGSGGERKDVYTNLCWNELSFN